MIITEVGLSVFHRKVVTSGAESPMSNLMTSLARGCGSSVYYQSTSPI